MSSNPITMAKGPTLALSPVLGLSGPSFSIGRAPLSGTPPRVRDFLDKFQLSSGVQLVPRFPDLSGDNPPPIQSPLDRETSDSVFRTVSYFIGSVADLADDVLRLTEGERDRPAGPMTWTLDLGALADQPRGGLPGLVFVKGAKVLHLGVLSTDTAFFGYGIEGAAMVYGIVPQDAEPICRAATFTSEPIPDGDPIDLLGHAFRHLVSWVGMSHQVRPSVAHVETLPPPPVSRPRLAEIVDHQRGEIRLVIKVSQGGEDQFYLPQRDEHWGDSTRRRGIRDGIVVSLIRLKGPLTGGDVGAAAREGEPIAEVSWRGGRLYRGVYGRELTLAERTGTGLRRVEEAFRKR